MYKFEYTISDFQTDEEYQKEFLTLFEIQDIMDDSLNNKLSYIYDLIKENEDWKKLLEYYSRLFPFIEESNLELSLPIAFTYSYLKNTHECLREFYFKKTTFLVQELIKSFDKK